MLADEVTCRSARKSRIPKTTAKQIRKLHLKVAEGSVKSRQASPRLKFEPAACLFVTVGEGPKLERGAARNRYEVAKGGWGVAEWQGWKREALLTDAKTSGIVVKVKQTTVAVVRFRSTLAARKVSFKLPFYRSHCGIIVPIRYYRREELNKSGVSPRSILSTLPKVDGILKISKTKVKCHYLRIKTNRAIQFSR